MAQMTTPALSPQTGSAVEKSDSIFANLQTTAIELLCLHRKFLIYNLVQRNLKLKYRQSFLGILWTVLAPALNAAVYFVVFSFVMRVQLPHYLVFVLSGLLPWMFFSLTLSQGMESIAGNWKLVTKVPLPLNVFPFVEVATCLLNYLLALPVLFVVALFDHAPFGLPMLMIPIYVALLTVQAYGFALLLSVSYVYFRDLRHVLSIFMQMWFYGTPIIYSAAMVPAKVQPYIWLNPIGYIFEGLNTAMAMGTFIDGSKVLISLAWTVVIFLGGAWVYRRQRRFLVEGI